MLADHSELVRLVVVAALVHYAHCPRNRSRVIGKILAMHVRRERGALVQCDLAEWSYEQTQSGAAIAKLAKLLAHRRGIVRWRACSSIPDLLRPSHAAQLLRAVRRRMSRERPGAMQDLLARLERRLASSIAVTSGSTAKVPQRAEGVGQGPTR